MVTKNLSTRAFAGMAGLFAFAVASVCLMAAPGQALEASAPETILVSLDQAKLVKLPAGADTIVIGNPSIADVTLQKNDVMVITGRAAGRTNFIAIDSSGTIISESVLTVVPSLAGRMVVQRGLASNTYDCSPICLPSVALGDDEKYFAGVVTQIGERDGMAKQTNGKAVAKK